MAWVKADKASLGIRICPLTICSEDFFCVWPLLFLFGPNFVLPENHGRAQGVRGGEHALALWNKSSLLASGLLERDEGNCESCGSFWRSQADRWESRVKCEGGDPSEPSVCSRVLCSVAHDRNCLLWIPFRSSCPLLCERCALWAARWKRDLSSKHHHGGVATGFGIKAWLQQMTWETRKEERSDRPSITSVLPQCELHTCSSQQQFFCWLACFGTGQRAQARSCVGIMWSWSGDCKGGSSDLDCLRSCHWQICCTRF